MPDREDITASYITKLAGHYQNLWSGAVSGWETVEDLYWNKNELWPVEMRRDRANYHSGRAAGIIDHGADNQLAYDPKVHRDPVGGSEEAAEAADRVEKVVKSILTQAALRETNLTWKSLGLYLIHLGYGVINGPRWDITDKPKKFLKAGESQGDSDERYEYQMKSWLPIRITAPPPDTILLDPMTKRPTEAIEILSMFAKDLAAHTQEKQRRGRKDVELWVVEKGANPLQEIKVYRYFTEKHIGLVANAKLLYVEKNMPGFTPFAHAFANYGHIPVGKHDVEHYPQYLARGLLHPITEALKMKDQAAAGRHTAQIDASYNIRGTTQEGPDAIRVANEMRGGFVQGLKKDDLWWAEVQNFPQWMWQGEASTDADIEFGSFSRSQAGLRQPGVHTVGQEAILSTAAMRKFQAPAIQMEQLASLVGQNILRLLDQQNHSITIDGVTLHPKDIKHDYNLRVTFQIVDPVLQLQKQERGMREVGQGLKSVGTYMKEDALRDDISGEQKELIKDRVRRRPDVMGIAEAAVAAEMGLEEAIKALEEAKRRLASTNGTQPLQESQDELVTAPAGEPAADLEPNELRDPITGDVVKPAPVDLA